MKRNYFCVGHPRLSNVDPKLQPMWEVPIHICEDETGRGKGNCLVIVYSGEEMTNPFEKDKVVAFAQKIVNALNSDSNSPKFEGIVHDHTSSSSSSS